LVQKSFVARGESFSRLFAFPLDCRALERSGRGVRATNLNRFLDLCRFYPPLPRLWRDFQREMERGKDCGQGQALSLRKISPSHQGRGKHHRLAFIFTDSVQERQWLQKIPVGWEPAPYTRWAQRLLRRPFGLLAMTLKAFSTVPLALLESKEFFACPDDLPEDDQPKDHI